MSNKNPTVVIDTIIDAEGTKTDNKKVAIYPISIFRYAWLERLNSPFVDSTQKFDVNNVIPSAYIFTHTADELRKYSSTDKELVIADAFKWSEELTMEDIPELIKALTDQMLKLNKVAPNATTEDAGDDIKKN